MPIRNRKTRPLVNEVATPVVPGFLLDAGVAAVQAFEAACRGGPVEASREALKLVHDLVTIVIDMRDRARTEPFEIRLADWAKAKSLSPKAAFRMAQAKKIPGLVQMGRFYFVRNQNLSSAALFARVHQP